MKKCMLIGLVTIFILSAFGTLCFAFQAEMVANTTKKGSFLVFPLIKAGSLLPLDNIDTIVSISNDSATSVHVMCVYKYVEPSSCLCENFEFTLTGYQPISFSVKTGLGYDGKAIPNIGSFITKFHPNSTGELKCWAVDSASAQNPISFNFLSGEATINEGDDMTWEYSAWRFAVGGGIAAGKVVGKKGQLFLTGTLKSYDKCPGKLIFPFIQQTPTLTGVFPNYTNALSGGTYQTVNNTLTLVPCKQDCVSGGSGNDSITNAELLVFDEYENGASGAYACVGCDNSTDFFSENLLSPKLHATTPGPFSNPSGPPGAIIVARGRALCPPFSDCNSTEAIPLLGVMSHQFVSTDGPIAGEAPTEVGHGQGWLLDCNGDNTTVPVSFTYR